jgi:hypothetical protein
LRDRPNRSNLRNSGEVPVRRGGIQNRQTCLGVRAVDRKRGSASHILARVPDLTKLTAMDWASIVSAFAATAAMIVSILAWRTASKALEASASSERVRRWEARVQAVVPIAVDYPGQYATLQHGFYAGEGYVPLILHVGASPVVDLRVIADMPTIPASRPSITNVGTLAADTKREVELLVDGLYADSPPPREDVPVRVQLRWFGQLGQWVVQEFTWNIGSLYEDVGQQWRMVRWHVDPKVEGMAALDIVVT